MPASATVNVTEHVPLTGIICEEEGIISISETELTTLNFRPTPYNASNTAITATVSDPTVLEVVSVSNRAGQMFVTVKGLKAGTATVTATTEEGGYTATATVTVTKYTPVTAISFDRTSLTTTYEPGKYEDIYFVFEPADATYPPSGISVTTSDRSVAVYSLVPNSSSPNAVRVFPVGGLGTCTITATIKDSDIPPATCVVTVVASE